MSVEGHARLGPSNKSWPYCAGQPREAAAYPDIAGKAAIDGTGSHLLLESCLIHKVRAEDYLGQIIGANHPDCPNGWMVAQDRVDRVQECLDYVNARFVQLQKDYPGHHIKVEAESKSDPGGMFGRDDWWGTGDVKITVTNDHGRCVFMEAIDYKDGRMRVDVRDNTQLISYLIGGLRPFVASGPELVRPHEWHKLGPEFQVTIVQPKTNPTVRHEILTPTKIEEWAEFLSTAAHATDDPDAPLVPDDKDGKGYCAWCPHGRAGNCNAHAERDLEKLKVMDTSTELTETGAGGFDIFSLSKLLMDDAQGIAVLQLTQLAELKPSIMAIFESAETEIERRVVAEPGSVPGWAMKPGRGSKAWLKDEEGTAETLKGKRIKQDFIWIKSLVTPAAILKNKDIPKEKLDKIKKELITDVAGKLSLTRVAVREKEAAEVMFADVDFSGSADQTVATVEPIEELSFC